VFRDRACEDRSQYRVKLADLGAAVMPQRATLRRVGEAEDFLDAAVAVRRYDEHATGQLS
jgi:hypothetical protein